MWRQRNGEKQNNSKNEKEKHRRALRWLGEERRIRVAYLPAEGSIRCQFRRMGMGSIGSIGNADSYLLRGWKCDD